MDFFKDHPLGKLRDYNLRKQAIAKRTRYVGRIVIFTILTYLIILGIGLFHCLREGKGIEGMGQMGDFMAVANTLFSALAFLLLIGSINIQREDLQLTQEEMQRQSEAQAKSQMALEHQNTIATEQKNYDDIRNHIDGLRALLQTPFPNSGVTIGYQLYYSYKFLIDGSYKSDNPIFKNEDYTNSLRLIHFKLSSIVILFKKKQLKEEDKCVLLLEITIVLHDFFSVVREESQQFWESRDLPMISEKTLWSFMQHLSYLHKEYEASLKQVGIW